MLVRKLNEKLSKVIAETQIEYVDDVTAVKEGVYEGSDIDKVVLSNIDDFSEDELAQVLDNYDYYRNCGGYRLFPSGYNTENGPYPAKLASALVKSKQNESITDVYNIFYRNHGDLKTWGEAGEIWKEDSLRNFDQTRKLFDWSISLGRDEFESYVNTLTDDIAKGYPEFAEIIKDKLLY